MASGELLIEVMRRLHTPGYEIPTPYFHHFIGEENEHMWFFAEFCLHLSAASIRTGAWCFRQMTARRR